MSNDLISRSAVLDIIKKHECDTSRIMSGVIELPTSYDVDNVVHRLEEINEDDNICEKFKDKDRRHCKNARGCFDCAIRESIEIIKSGCILKR